MVSSSLNLSLISPLTTFEISNPSIEVSPFWALDSYLQSVNFENNLKKYRFWKNLVSEVPKDKETNEAKQVA
jgi:hypothetical protein